MALSWDRSAWTSVRIGVGSGGGAGGGGGAPGGGVVVGGPATGTDGTPVTGLPGLVVDVVDVVVEGGVDVVVVVVAGVVVVVVDVGDPGGVVVVVVVATEVGEPSVAGAEADALAAGPQGPGAVNIAAMTATALTMVAARCTGRGINFDLLTFAEAERLPAPLEKGYPRRCSGAGHRGPPDPAGGLRPTALKGVSRTPFCLIRPSVRSGDPRPAPPAGCKDGNRWRGSPERAAG
jgi:hypothetical protein